MMLPEVCGPLIPVRNCDESMEVIYPDVLESEYTCDVGGYAGGAP
jgi:hypothetical protein